MCLDFDIAFICAVRRKGGTRSRRRLRMPFEVCSEPFGSIMNAYCKPLGRLLGALGVSGNLLGRLSGLLAHLTLLLFVRAVRGGRVRAPLQLSE
eukprot:7570360-Pyramimonas_sp.AAC.1